jgi:glycine betaine/proline transport system permease protein
MSVALAAHAAPRQPAWGGRLLWAAVAAASLGFQFLPRGALAGWWAEVPRAAQLPLARGISDAVAWLVEDARLGPVAFRDLTRGLAAVLDVPLEAARSLLATGLLRGDGSSALQLLPPLPWLGLTAAAALLGLHAGGVPLALLVGGALGYLAVFGQWQSAMVTLASIAIAVPLGVAGGLLLGIAAYRHPRFDRLLAPALDAMQTVPVFAYLLPILILFGFGPVAALIATIIYAMPPMVRVTLLALRGVSPEIVEFGRMAGATPRQLVWRVMLPAARAPLMVGVNQVIMLSLNMVIIASMIGAGGLGYDVLTSLRRLDIGAGLEAGLAIVVLAIALDRLSQAYAVRAGQPVRAGRSRLPLAALAAALALWVLGFALPAVAVYPERWEVSTGPFWAGLIAWLNVSFFDTFEAIKTAILVNLLVPVRRFLLAIPWWWGTLVVAFAMWRIGGARRAAIAGAFGLFVAFTGYWEEAMTTVYLCGVSVAIAAAVGIPVGLASALRPRVWRVVEAVIDTLQTLPSFVYLIPVVMLFRVGEFTAMIAIVLYAVAPAIRYTALGIREVDPALIEAATAMGTTPAQRLGKVRLPLALPEILLGLNQTILLAISMLVITALVGTRDLGQEVYIALTEADVGRGLVTGACIAMIAMIADRMMTQAALRARRRLGLA